MLLYTEYLPKLFLQSFQSRWDIFFKLLVSFRESVVALLERSLVWILNTTKDASSNDISSNIAYELVQQGTNAVGQVNPMLFNEKEHLTQFSLGLNKLFLLAGRRVISASGNETLPMPIHIHESLVQLCNNFRSFLMKV